MKNKKNITVFLSAQDLADLANTIRDADPTMSCSVRGMAAIREQLTVFCHRDGNGHYHARPGDPLDDPLDGMLEAEELAVGYEEEQ